MQVIDRLRKDQEILYLPNEHNYMKEFLRKIGLLDTLSVNLNIDRREFTNALRSSVEEGSIGPFSEIGDVFSRSKKEYKGHVGLESFRIARRRRLFEMNSVRAVAMGKFHQNDDVLSVETEISGFTHWMTFFLVIILLFYVTSAVTIFSSNEQSDDILGFVLPALLVHGLFMIGIPYFLARRSVKRLKYDLERELYYLAGAAARVR